MEHLNIKIHGRVQGVGGGRIFAHPSVQFLPREARQLIRILFEKYSLRLVVAV